MPRHVAIVMDGNGRWAKKRLLPRIVGHKKGLETFERTVGYCHDFGVEELTVFAFSSENWRRPKDEVEFLMKLFSQMIEIKVKKLHENGIRLRFLGERGNFNPYVAEKMREAEELTQDNKLLKLNVAVDYGGRWDIVNAVRKMMESGVSDPKEVTEESLARHLSLSDDPEPDLYIRTGGEMRVSNFLLWQMAYTEFYFTDTLWPDFDKDEFAKAIASFSKRERRFGRTSEQLPVEERRPLDED